MRAGQVVKNSAGTAEGAGGAQLFVTLHRPVCSFGNCDPRVTNVLDRVPAHRSGERRLHRLAVGIGIGIERAADGAARHAHERDPQHLT